MDDLRLFTREDVHETYRDIHNVLLTGWIIRQYSVNSEDVRTFALTGLDLSHVRHVLELGCGYGFFTEKLKDRLHPDADIMGIDIVEENRFAYINTVNAMKYRGGFISSESDCIKYFNENTYDLVISSYSLYFFPHLIKEISRILTKGGIFLVLTHSRGSLLEAVSLLPSIIVKEGGPLHEQAAMTRLFHRFPLEEGYDMLSDNFNSIEVLSYENSMFFPEESIDDCIFYLETKKNLLYKDILDMGDDVLQRVKAGFHEALKNRAKKEGGIYIQKNDAAFQCCK
jgi:SAM-dependent methyltransferase